MTAANETFSCPECAKEIAHADAIRHRNKHWGEARGFSYDRLSKEGKERYDQVTQQQSAKEE